MSDAIVVNIWQLAVRSARHLLHGQLALYCKGDFQSDGIQAAHFDMMLAKSSDMRVSPVKDAQFHGKLFFVMADI